MDYYSRAGARGFVNVEAQMRRPRTLVFGLGLTGYSCLRFLYHQCSVAVCDTRETPPFLDKARAEFGPVEVTAPEAVDLNDFDRIVVSPGVALDHPLVTRARVHGLELTSDIDLFLCHAHAPVIAITGTNGKSTVTALVGELLAKAFGVVNIGGNFGVAALDLLDDEADRYVLELSSFQLERLSAGGFDIACLLNVSADHQDRYVSIEAYAATKRRIFHGCRAAVYDGIDPRTRPDREVNGIELNVNPEWQLLEDTLILGGKPQPLSSFHLQGRHNAQNLLAGAAVGALCDIEISDMIDVLTCFRGMPHRCAPAGWVGSVRFINDSKATNVGACSAALYGFGKQTKNIVLIAGGDGKGASFEPLREPISSHAKHVVLLGRDAERLEETLSDVVSTSRADDIAQAAQEALSKTGDGDIVLLSPACASLDMFESFEARGDEFVEAVTKLGGVRD